MTAGRPTEFKDEYIEQADKLCALGATDADIADFFDVSARTIYRWKHEHPEFCQSLKDGKEVADERVKRSLYQRACGYTVDAVKIFMPANADEPVYADYKEHIPADTGAAVFWLKNRSGWKDKHEVQHTGSIAVNIDTDHD